MIYNEKIEMLINAALADGVLTEKEKQVLFRRAQEEGIDLDEFEMVLDARLVELQKVEKEKAEKAAPKSNKYGDVRKCPSCGAIVQAYKGICGECGYEFSNIDANLSSRQLANALRDVAGSANKAEIIETFPIPMTKADLLEFLTSLKPRIKDSADPLSKSYFKKYEECIEKAKVSFSNDKEIRPFIDEFPQIKKSITRAQMISNSADVLSNGASFLGEVISWLFAHKIVLGIIIFVLIGISLSISESCEDSVEEDVLVQATEAINRGDLDKASNLLLKVRRYNINGEDEKLMNVYLEKNDIDNAIKIYEIKENETYSNKIYNKCIELGDYDKAWTFMSKSYSSNDYIGNAPERFKFMSDVIIYLCDHNKIDEAKKFNKNQSVWFQTNVDGSSYKDHHEEFYKEFNFETAKAKLNKIIDNY